MMMSHHAFVKRAILAALLGAAVSAAVVLSLSASATAQPPTLTSVSPRALTERGISLDTPAQAATVSRDAAVRVALWFQARSEIRDAVVAQVRAAGLPEINGRTCWVVSIMPPGGIWSVIGEPGAPRLPQKYLLVFVDARTGAFLLATSST